MYDDDCDPGPDCDDDYDVCTDGGVCDLCDDEPATLWVGDVRRCDGCADADGGPSDYECRQIERRQMGLSDF